MTTQRKPLDPDTCEAIAERFRAQRSDYTNMGECCIGSIAKWAEGFVRGMAQEAKQPEPPAPTPTAGAVRAAEIITLMKHGEATFVTTTEGSFTVAGVAAIIDRETGLPQLVAVCRGCDMAITEFVDAKLPTATDWVNLRSARERARSALAKHETGVSEPAAIPRAKGSASCEGQDSG